LKILGIDTSSKILSLAFSDGLDIIKEETCVLEKRHSSLLVPKIKNMLEEIGLSIKDVDAFIVGLGPGSFTGLRIGVSAIKGFGLATDKPCIGVLSIDALAMNVKNRARSIVPVLDAKRGNVYSSIYSSEKGNTIKKSKNLLLKIDELMKKIKGEAVFLGDGVGLYKEKIQRMNKKAVFLQEEYWYPGAANLIRLGFSRINKYKRKDLNRLNPVYLYPRDCQVKKQVC